MNINKFKLIIIFKTNRYNNKIIKNLLKKLIMKNISIKNKRTIN